MISFFLWTQNTDYGFLIVAKMRFCANLSFVSLLLAALLYGGVAVSRIQIVSPLQALTVWDPEVNKEEPTWRSRFLPRYKVGLEAEASVRKEYDNKRKKLAAKATAAAAKGKNWAARAQAAERDLQRAEDASVEAAYDRAVKDYETQKTREKRVTSVRHNRNQYQFVGLVQPSSAKQSGSPITWYARKKPSKANWSIRLLHVNRPAVIKDLFEHGKVDLFASYSNTGRVDETSGLPVITGDYKIRERSWRYA